MQKFEQSLASVDMFENYSYVRSATQAGNLADDTLSTVSSFHPTAVSTTTKWPREDDIIVPPNRYRLSMSSLIARDDAKGAPDESSLGLLDSGHFKSTESTLDANEQGRGGGTFSLLDDILAQQLPNISAEFAQQDIQDNREFIAKEEARNKAEHPFIQEEIIGDPNEHCDTTSWTVSRPHEPSDDKPGFHTSNNSNVSVSSFFQRHSGPLGEFNGSVLSNCDRPTFGLTTIDKKKGRKSHTATVPGERTGADGASVVHGGNKYAPAAASDGIGNCLDDIDKTIMGTIVTAQENRKSHSSQRNEHGSTTTVRRRLIAKPPKVPVYDKASSPLADRVPNDSTSPHRQEKSLFGLPETSSFLSLSAIQALLADVSIGGNASTLAKKIMSKSDEVLVEKRKKTRCKENVEQSVDRKDFVEHGASLTNPNANTGKVENAMLQSIENRTQQDHVPKSQNGQPPVEQPLVNTESVTRDSISVEMKVGGVTFKGVLYAQPDVASGDSTL